MWFSLAPRAAVGSPARAKCKIRFVGLPTAVKREWCDHVATRNLQCRIAPRHSAASCWGCRFEDPVMHYLGVQRIYLVAHRRLRTLENYDRTRISRASLHF